MDLGLAGKVVLVTAATSNIGRGIALEFAREGARVAIVGRDADAGAAVVAAARDRGALDAYFVVADLLDPASPARIMEDVAGWGAIDILVNNLGGNVGRGLFVESDPDSWAGDIDLNFGAMLRMTHPVLKTMVARGAGAIVNVGSTAGIVGDYRLPVYSAMKGAVHSFTIALAKEVGQHGIRVNAIAPYATFSTDRNAFSRGSRFHPESGIFAQGVSMSEHDRALTQRRTFVGRPYATPEDLAAVVALLASDRAGFVTGQVWPVDGGALL